MVSCAEQFYEGAGSVSEGRSTYHFRALAFPSGAKSDEDVVVVAHHYVEIIRRQAQDAGLRLLRIDG